MSLIDIRLIRQIERTARQCERCRHSCTRNDRLVCRKRRVQRCKNDGATQRLEMVPGVCSTINPKRDCPVFKPRRRVDLYERIEDVFDLLASLFVATIALPGRSRPRDMTRKNGAPSQKTRK